MEHAHGELRRVGLDEELGSLAGPVTAFREGGVDAEHAQNGSRQTSLGRRVATVESRAAAPVRRT